MRVPPQTLTQLFREAQNARTEITQEDIYSLILRTSGRVQKYIRLQSLQAHYHKINFKIFFRNCI